MTALTSELVRPLRVMFLITSMPIGGAETLLLNLVRRLDRSICIPEICCLKEPGALGEEAAKEIPVHSHLISHKFDVAVVPRLRRLFRDRHSDAIVTVGAGDKMFWGRIAARYSGMPIILSALHSTGWPDGVGRLNRLLTRITDGFIAVARQHARHLVENEQFPLNKVFLIPNGIDTQKFVFDPDGRARIRREFSIQANDAVVGIVAALRPEKNHELFLRAAHRFRQHRPNSHFLIVGDGPQRSGLEQLTSSLGLSDCVHFLGSRSDVPQVLSALDLFVLTSHNEASPVSILEAMACERPVVAPDVGSISESVLDTQTGLLVDGHDLERTVGSWLSVLSNDGRAKAMGAAARAHVVEHGSLDAMTRGYESLIRSIYLAKQPRHLAADQSRRAELRGAPADRS